MATIEAIKSTSPLIVYPLKAAVAFPLVYHYLGGVRHVFWDKAKYGNQVSLIRLYVRTLMQLYSHIADDGGHQSFNCHVG